MKTCLLGILLGLPAFACDLSIMEKSLGEYTLAAGAVVNQFSMDERRSNILGNLYHAYGGVVVEVITMDELGTCKPYVIDVTWSDTCIPQVSERAGDFTCI